jgi:hypothetical protein
MGHSFSVVNLLQFLHTYCLLTIESLLIIYQSLHLKNWFKVLIYSTIIHFYPVELIFYCWFNGFKVIGHFILFDMDRNRFHSLGIKCHNFFQFTSRIIPILYRCFTDFYRLVLDCYRGLLCHNWI